MTPTAPDNSPAAKPGAQGILADLDAGESIHVRGRLLVIAACAGLVGMFTCVTDVALPLWVTADLGYSPAQWARVRSLRFTGVMVGVIVFGVLADRFGQRRTGAVMMVAGALLLAGMSVGGGWSLWLFMPFFGAAVSTVYVNLNTLAQTASVLRQGLANSIYRGVTAAAMMVAPLAATGLAGVYGFPVVLQAAAVLLGLAAVVSWRYPGESAAVPLASLGDEWRGLIHGYVATFRQKHLMRFVWLNNALLATTYSIGTFAAIRFTAELAQTENQFGLLASIAGVLTFAAAVMSGLLVDRLGLRPVTVGMGLCAAAGMLLMGSGNDVRVAAAGYMLAAPAAVAMVTPTSMWVTRAAGNRSAGGALAMYKVISAVFTAGTMALLGQMEQWVGIRLIWLFSGLAAAALALAHLALTARVAGSPQGTAATTGAPPLTGMTGGAADNSHPPSSRLHSRPN